VLLFAAWQTLDFREGGSVVLHGLAGKAFGSLVVFTPHL
jgi:hypothetical protein